MERHHQEQLRNACVWLQFAADDMADEPEIVFDIRKKWGAGYKKRLAEYLSEVLK